MDRFFRKVDNAVWDLSTGRIGIRTNEGIVSIENNGTDLQIVINMFDQFGMEVPAFAQNTPVDAVTIGDLIYGAKGALGWVVEKKEKSFTVLKPDGTRTNWSPPKVQMLGFDNGVMVLRSLINVLPGGQAGLNSINSMLMPMMMMSGGNVDLGSMMPMILMSQMQQPAVDPANPNAQLLQQNNMGQMMQMMMMAQLFNKGGSGKGGSNFFDNK